MKKKLVLICVLFVLLAALCAGCSRASDWVQFRGEGGRGVSRSRITPPLGIRWKIKLQLEKEYENIDALNPPVVMGDTVYFGSTDGNFYALDVESGYMRWVYKAGAEINSVPYADGSQVYFGSKDGGLRALSRESGEEIWTFPTGSQINSQVERYRDQIIFAGDSDAIYFLSPEGKENFRIDNPGWANFTFLMADDVMYFATGPRVELIGPYDLNAHEFLWYIPYYEIAAGWYSFPAVRGDLVYFGTADAWYGYDGMSLGFYAYDKRSGRQVWTQRIEAEWGDGSGSRLAWNASAVWNLYLRDIEMLDFMAPTVWRDLVIFSGGDSGVRAFDAETGASRWETFFDMPVCSAPTIAGGRVYFGLLGDETVPPQFVCVSARDGRLLWQMETEGSLLSAPVIAGRRIIFGTDKSVFYVLEQVL